MTPKSRLRLASVLTASAITCGVLAVLALGHEFLTVLGHPSSKLDDFWFPLWIGGFVMAFVAAFLVPSGKLVLRIANTLVIVTFIALTLYVLSI